MSLHRIADQLAADIGAAIDQFVDAVTDRARTEVMSSLGLEAPVRPRPVPLRPPLTKEETESAVEMLKTGAKYHDVASAFGVNVGTICRIRQRHLPDQARWRGRPRIEVTP